MLSGVVVISSKDSVQHQGVSLTMEGTVNLQLSAKSVGVFEAFYNSVKVRARATLMLGAVVALQGSWSTHSVCFSVLPADTCTCPTRLCWGQRKPLTSVVPGQSSRSARGPRSVSVGHTCTLLLLSSTPKGDALRAGSTCIILLFAVEFIF